MAFVYRFPAPEALTEGELREQLEARGLEALYVRRGHDYVQLSLELELTPAQETNVADAIATYSWSSRRDLVRQRAAEAKAAIAAVADGPTRAALTALARLVYAVVKD